MKKPTQADDKVFYAFVCFGTIAVGRFPARLVSVDINVMKDALEQWRKRVREWDALGGSILRDGSGAGSICNATHLEIRGYRTRQEAIDADISGENFVSRESVH